MLDLQLDLGYVEALCERAIAQGWDSGRVGYPSQTPLPFQDEVSAILRPISGLAKEELARCTARLAELAARRREVRARSGELSPAARGARTGLACPGSARLPSLAQEFSLSELAADILLIIAAPSVRGELARLYAIIANDPDRPLCDEFLLCQMFSFGMEERSKLARELDAGSPLIRYGLITVGAGERPFAQLTVDPLVTRWLQGETFERSEPGSPVELRRADRKLDQLILPTPLLNELLHVTTHTPHETLRLVVRGRLGSGRRTLLAVLTEELGRLMGILDLGLLAPIDEEFPGRLRDALREIVLRGWWPCIDGLDRFATLEGDVRDRVRAILRQHPGPLLFRCGADVMPPLAPGYRLIDLPPLSESQRVAAFRDALIRHSLSDDVAEQMAAKHRIGPGLIERVVSQVARWEDENEKGVRAKPTLAMRLEAVMRQHRDNQIGHFAARVTRLASWDQVVIPEDVSDSVCEFIGRIRHRQLVFERWGMDRVLTSARGLTALFEGRPGTGKSMVAGLIARELDYELYRVDLSRILSKWIGETEQNLARVFDIAEDGQVIILFDEADALFTKRTEVSTSVDRYANAEVNYLLQRLDSFEGIAILTTNLEKSIDTAFKRRMSLRLTFPFPDEDMREQLWAVHLPERLPIEGTLDLRTLAERYELSGGYIRNAVLRATFLAAMEGCAVSQGHLERAVRLEYRERGKLYEGGVLE